MFIFNQYTFLPIQEDFNTAIARLVAGGIHTKMINNAQAVIKLPSYWTVPIKHDIEPLTPVHVMLQFILCLGGLSLAMIVFVIEIIRHKAENVQAKSVHTESIEMNATRGRGERAIMRLVEL